MSKAEKETKLAAKGRFEAGEMIMTFNFKKRLQARGGGQPRGNPHHNGDDQYTTTTDFCRIFSEETDRLYLLAYLLTADQEKAQHCFVCGLQNSVQGNPVFKEWGRSWARRAIIQSAVRAIRPRPIEENAHAGFGSNDKIVTPEPPEIVAVLQLDAFERFIYVMSVLEQYSDHDCSLLLGCARRDIVAGRIRALQQTGRAMELHLASAERVSTDRLSRQLGAH